MFYTKLKGSVEGTYLIKCGTAIALPWLPWWNREKEQRKKEKEKKNRKR